MGTSEEWGGAQARAKQQEVVCCIKHIQFI